MTKEKEKNCKRAQQLRQEGCSFGQIAKELGVSISTVKSWCYRTSKEPLSRAPAGSQKKCPQCGGDLPPSRFKARRFCSDACRAQYWHTHSEQINRRTAVKSLCPVCHKSFQDYAQRHRKYCCHACYIAARYHGGGLDE